MAFEAITLEGTNVSAEMDAFINEALFGFSGVLKYGNNLMYQIISTNEIRIKDGLLINQGRFGRIKPGTTHSVSIRSGQAGVTRYDLIVAHFESSGMEETFDIRVIEGKNNGPIPEPVKGNTFTGATVNELPLYVIKLNGVNIESVTQKFTVYDSLFSMAKKFTISTSKPSGGTDGDIWFEIEE